jgi:hypothetical protein
MQLTIIDDTYMIVHIIIIHVLYMPDTAYM